MNPPIMTPLPLCTRTRVETLSSTCDGFSRLIGGGVGELVGSGDALGSGVGETVGEGVGVGVALGSGVGVGSGFGGTPEKMAATNAIA